MIDPIRNHSQSKRFNFGNGIFTCLSVSEDAGKIRNFGNPAPVIFFLDIYLHFIFL